MVTNTQLPYSSRLREFTTAHSHAMPRNLVNLCINDSIGIGARLIAPDTLMAQGISVPISRGGPPLLYE